MSLIYNIHNSPGTVQEGVYETCEIDYGREAISLYTEALDVLSGLDEAYVRGTYNSIKKSDVTLLAESADEYVLGTIKSLESASFQMMKMFDHQVKYLNTVLDKNERFIAKYGEYLLSKDIKNVTYTGYWFTLDAPIPDSTPMNEFINSVKNGVKTLETLTNKDVEVCETEVTYSTYPDMLRARIIRSNKRKLDIDDYQLEIFKAFRNGKRDPLAIAIDKKDMVEIIHGMKNLKAVIATIVRERETFREEYKAAIAYLQTCRNSISGAKMRIPTIYMRRGKEVVVDPDIKNQTPVLYDDDYYRYLMLISRKAQLHFYMYNIAYGEKLAAVRDFCRQNGEIIIEYIKKGEEI